MILSPPVAFRMNYDRARACDERHVKRREAPGGG